MGVKNLFTLYTDDHRDHGDQTMIIKYADDTALVGLLKAGDEHLFSDCVRNFVTQCEDDDLTLNVAKTKEMVIDFRKNTTHDHTVINNQEVERVSEYKYLGVFVQDDLKWSTHLTYQTKKATQRLYHLRKLREFQVVRSIQILFYASTIESVLLYGSLVWGGSCSNEDRRKLLRVTRNCEKVISATLDPWSQPWEKRTVKKAREIFNELSHPLNSQYQLLPSQRRLRLPASRTSRFKKSFIPNSISFLNKL